MIAFLFGCADVEKEIRKNIEGPLNGRGELFFEQICGFPSAVKPEMTEIKVSLNSGSSSNDGSGVVKVIGLIGEYRCDSEIFFTYSRSYSGGNVLTGGDYLNFSSIRRLTPVVKTISAPESALSVSVGYEEKGLLSSQSGILPDGSFCCSYRFDVLSDGTVFRIKPVRREGDILPRLRLYQNGQYLSTGIQRGVRLKKGRAYIIVSGGSKPGSFTFLVEKLSEDESRIIN